MNCEAGLARKGKRKNKKQDTKGEIQNDKKYQQAKDITIEISPTKPKRKSAVCNVLKEKVRDKRFKSRSFGTISKHGYKTNEPTKKVWCPYNNSTFVRNYKREY